MRQSIIHVENSMPLWLRSVMAIFAVGLLVQLYREMSPALWPIGLGSIIPAFFILGGGLVLAVVLIASIFGANEIWEISRGRVRIVQTVLGRSRERILERSHLIARVEMDRATDGPNTWHLVLDMRMTASGNAGPGPTLKRTVPGRMQWRSKRMIRSPAFASKADADRALELLSAR